MTTKKYGFQKIERLRLRKDIQRLYEQGISLFVYPFKARYLIVEKKDLAIPAQVLITVSGKTFKKAVHRNRIKRLIRESYRLNKYLLTVQQDKVFHIHFHYISKKILDFHTVQKGMQELLAQINQRSNSDLNLPSNE